MAAETDPAAPNQPPGKALPPVQLPPVQPPSGRFIAQLFLVPGMIVLVAVLLLLGFRYAIGTGYTPASFLKQLDSDNPDIRWRGASDLAQVLKRPESMPLKSDAAFALDLAERLQDAFTELVRKEEDAKNKKTEEERKTAWRKLRVERNHVRFLAACLGDFVVPVGAPVLKDIVLQANPAEPQGYTLRRRQGVWSLGHMGANLKEFVKLAPEKKAEIIDVLEKEAAGSIERRAAWARFALHYLNPDSFPFPSQDKLLRADEILARCAEADDRYLREQTALAISFWKGPLVERTLIELAADSGQGTLIQIPDTD